MSSSISVISSMTGSSSGSFGDPRGPAWCGLAKRGPGLHHIAFAVDDINDTMASLGDKGVQFVGDTPVTLATSMVDFAGRRFDDEISFTFSHPASILGILFEFIQYPDGFATP